MSVTQDAVKEFQGGAKFMDLVAKGYNRSTLSRAKKLFEEGQRAERVGSGPPTVHVRLTGETIELPTELFHYYHVVLRNTPGYTPTKSEFIQEIFWTWVNDYGEYLGFFNRGPMLGAIQHDESRQHPWEPTLVEHGDQEPDGQPVNVDIRDPGNGRPYVEYSENEGTGDEDGPDGGGQ